MATTADKEAVYRTWNWCASAYLQHGNRKLSMPQDTDPTKTYQWRYMEALARRLQDLELNEQQSRTFIEIAVLYARSHNLLKKGLTIFMQANLLDVCYEELRSRETTQQSTVGIITNTSAWLRQELENYRRKSPTRAAKTLIDMLLHCETPGGYANIVRWHQAGNLPEHYIVLSRSCGLAISTLAKAKSPDRTLLPKDSRLFMLRTKLLNDSSVRLQVRNILGDDWRKPL